MQSLIYTLQRLIVCLDGSGRFPDVGLADPWQSSERCLGVLCHNKLLKTRLYEFPKLGADALWS